MFVPDPVISMSIKPAKKEQVENFSKGKKMFSEQLQKKSYKI